MFNKCMDNTLSRKSDGKHNIKEFLDLKIISQSYFSSIIKLTTYTAVIPLGFEVVSKEATCLGCCVKVKTIIFSSDTTTILYTTYIDYTYSK